MPAAALGPLHSYTWVPGARQVAPEPPSWQHRSRAPGHGWVPGCVNTARSCQQPHSPVSIAQPGDRCLRGRAIRDSCPAHEALAGQGTTAAAVQAPQTPVARERCAAAHAEGKGWGRPWAGGSLLARPGTAGLSTCVPAVPAAAQSPQAPATPHSWQPRLTIFPVLEGGGELFGSDPGDPGFLLGFVGCSEGCLGLGPRVGGPGGDEEAL